MLDTAASIAKELPAHIKKVGVFSNQSESEIKEIVSIVGLDFIQLHGQETAEFASKMPLPVIKACSIESNQDLDMLENYPATYFLVDLPKSPKSQQNKPKTLDWSALASAHTSARKDYISWWINC